MNWSNEWKPPVVNPNTMKALEILSQAKEHEEINGGLNPLSIGIDFGSKDKSILTVMNGQKKYLFHAEIIGDLALDFSDDGWNIYHVPTLSCFSKAVPENIEQGIGAGFEYDREQLLAWMAKVQTNYPTSWQMLRLLTPQNYADKGQSAKDIILKWCLSQPV